MRAAGYCLARFVQQGIAPVLWPDMLSFAGRSPGSGFAASFSVSCILQGLVACHTQVNARPLARQDGLGRLLRLPR